MILHIFKLIWNRKRQNLLVTLEVFVSFLVLFAVSVLVLQLLYNYSRPLGYDVENIWDITVDVKHLGNEGRTAEMSDRIRQLHEAAKRFDEVLGVAGMTFSPYSLGTTLADCELGGRMVKYERNDVTDDFREVMGLTIVKGRWFSREDDGAEWEPAVINLHFAEKEFPGEEAIGKDIALESDPSGGAGQSRRLKVIGIVSEFRKDGEYASPINYVFVRRRLDDPSETPPREIAVRIRPGTPVAFEEKLVRRLQSVAPDWSYDVTPLTSMRESSLRLRRVPVLLAAIISGFLMLMVALGLMGVLWQSITRRTREFGLRRAKGAAASDIFRQILGEIAVITTFGVVAGLLVVVQLPILDLIGVVAMRVYVTSAMIAAAAMYALATASGAYPALLATRIQPAEALHYE